LGVELYEQGGGVDRDGGDGLGNRSPSSRQPPVRGADRCGSSSTLVIVFTGAAATGRADFPQAENWPGPTGIDGKVPT
jgi:hypothetical protein